MSCEPYYLGCIPVGKVDQVRLQFVDDLGSDLLTGTPTAIEIGLATLTIGAPARNTTVLTLDNVTVQADQAVIVPIEVIKYKKDRTVVRVECATTNANRNVVAYFSYQTVKTST